MKLSPASDNVGLFFTINFELLQLLIEIKFKMIVVLLLLGVATFIYMYLKWCYSFWNRKNVPAPEPSPFVGNIGPTLIFTKHMATILEEWYK